MQKKIRETERAERDFDTPESSEYKYRPDTADIAFAGALGFLAGTLAVGFGWDIALVIFCAIVVGVAFRKNTSIIAAGIVCSIVGSAYCAIFTHVQASNLKLPTGNAAAFLAIVSDEPTAAASGKSVLVPATLEKPYAGAVTIFAKLGADYRYGDELRVTGEMEPSNAPGETPGVFPKEIQLVAHDRGSWLRERLLGFKAAVEAKFDAAFNADGTPGASDTDVAALLGGETFGGTDGMSPSLKTAMAASGTSYVVAMYGYKIAMIVAALEAMFAGWLARRWRFAAIVAAIALFVAMTGGNVSAMRAGMMIGLALLGRQLGRTFDARHTLVLVAAGMALADPTLPAQAGFELSFLSVAGMLYLVHPLEHCANRFVSWPPGDPGFLGWREAIVLAIASLLPIVPVIAVSFGDFSLAAFPSNIFISFGVMPALLTGVALAIAGFAAPPVAYVVAKLAEVVLAYQLAVIKIFATMDWPLPFSFASVWIWVVYYAGLAWFVWKYQ